MNAVRGCEGCATSAGAHGCPTHFPRLYPNPPTIDYRQFSVSPCVVAKQCNHCWCEESSHPDHVQCCKCRDYMHINFVYENPKPTSD